MPYEIELEDRGQDLFHLTVDQYTGEITDAGLHSRLYADGNHFVHNDQLMDDRHVHYTAKDGSENIFRWPMVKLSLDGQVLAEAT